MAQGLTGDVAADFLHVYVGPRRAGDGCGHRGLLGGCCERREGGGKPAAGLVQSGLYRVHRDAQLGGHFPVGKALQVEQQDRVALPTGN